MTETKVQPRGALNNGGWNAFGTLFSIVVTFVVAPLLIGRLGTDQWGLLLLVWSVTGVLGMANLGFGEATLRFVAHHLADGNMAGVNRVLGATLTFYVSVCALVSGLLFVTAPTLASWFKVSANEYSQVALLLRLSALLFSFGMIANAIRSIPMALQRYDISNKIGLGQNVVRPLGAILLVVAGMGVVHIVIWEVLVAFAALWIHALVARRLVPGVRCTPSMSFAGIREILGYSVFTFMTHVFLTIYREGGKLLLGSRVGATSVAYLGTPDNVASRLHTVVISGTETLLPRFSTIRDVESRKALVATATWAAVTCGVVLYLPLAILMPDFLRLWINADFARQSAVVGQLLALSWIGPAAFNPIATLFRGMGKPGVVTLVMAIAGTAVLVTTVLLLSSHGVLAVGYGYILSCIAWFGGLIAGWLFLFGPRSIVLLFRVAGLPLLLGSVLGAAQLVFRGWWGPLGWVGLFTMGSAFAGLNAIVVPGVDYVLGGDSKAAQFVARILRSERLAALRQRLTVAPVRMTVTGKAEVIGKR